MQNIFQCNVKSYWCNPAFSVRHFPVLQIPITRLLESLEWTGIAYSSIAVTPGHLLASEPTIPVLLH